MKAGWVLLALLAGCGGAAPRFVAEARAVNTRADALLNQGDSAGAARVLEAFVAQPVPAGIAPDDRRGVLQDAYARLASLAVSTGRAVEALRFAETGLALGDAHDVFAASLHTVHGRANEALGRDRDAARDYEAAQIIAASLLDAELRKGGER